MKVVLPLAGKGTRLLPLTRHVPKPLLRVAGRAVLDHILDRLQGLAIDELIVITGHLKEQVEQHFRRHCALPTRFIEQTVRDGTAGAIKLARPLIDGPLLIVYVDTLFEADLQLIERVDADGIIWTKEVEDYQRFGVVVTDDRGCMTRIVEKPSEPVSRLANIGLYYFRDWETLFAGIDDVYSRPGHNGEWYLTEAFQFMVDRGRRLQTAEVQGWHDCGKVATLLETNHYLLSTGSAQAPAGQAGVCVIPPVRVGSNVILKESTIGPNVSINDRTIVRTSRLENVIVGEDVIIEDSTINNALIGDGCRVSQQTLASVVVAEGEIAPAR